MTDLHLSIYDLPDGLSLDMGRIVTRASYMQNYLQKIIYLLVGVQEEIGRIAIREPRTRDRIDMILDLIAVRNLKVPDVDLKHLREVIDDAEDFRNLCAHGAWSYSAKHQSWYKGNLGKSVKR